MFYSGGKPFKTCGSAGNSPGEAFYLERYKFYASGRLPYAPGSI